MSETHKKTSEISEDIERHRIMRGYPPQGEIFTLKQEEEVKKRINKLKESAQHLTKLLEEDPNEKKENRSSSSS